VTDQPTTGAQESATCYRHPEREAHIRCARCNRRICPDCMVNASVGFQCPECVREGNKGVRRARTVFGGNVTDSPGVVSKVLIAINVVMFILQEASRSVESHLYLIGAFPPPPFMPAVGVADGEYYRLLTAAFLHGGPLHLLLNMYALYLFGPPLEAALGRVRFVALYFVAALGGSALSYAFSNPAQPSLGASGAIFGLLGAYLVISLRLHREVTGILVLLAINFAFSFYARGTIDWRAHVGGFLAGSVCALAFVYAPQTRRPTVQVAGVLLVLAVEVAVVVGRTMELTG
jgi:membrane associated rhomboid family serine protease